MLAAIRFFDGQQASQRADSICHRGFFYHFLDMETGRRAWKSEISFIDTAILLAGMQTAAAYFDGSDALENELQGRVDQIASRVDWPWACDRALRLRMGWKPERGFLPGHWHGYSEALLMLVLGSGSTSSRLDPQCFRNWLHSCVWRGGNLDGHFRAGPLFIHLFPQIWLDLRGSLIQGRTIDWFENTKRAVAAQRAYALTNPQGFSGYGGDVWGLTACQGPRKRTTLRNRERRWIAGYRARGTPPSPDDGTLAPWAPLACLPFAPDEAIRATRRILAVYPDVMSGGMFADAFNPSVHAQTAAGWVSPRCTGIDQGLLVASIENFRTGLPWHLGGCSASFRRGRERLGL